MSKITFIGMGAMGSRMTMHLIKAGYNVCVWNRNAERTKALTAAGAVTAHSPREATYNADVVISMLRDDWASKATWCYGD